MSRHPVRDKAVVYTAAAGKVVPAEYDREAALAQWPRWSLGIRVANFLFASGAGGMEADGIVRHADDPRAQARLAMHRLVTLVQAGGAVADDLITVRVFLDDPANADAIVAGVGEYLDEHLTTGRPAFSIVVANTSDPSVCAEIEAFAATSSERVRCEGVPQGPAAGFAHAVRVANLHFVSAQLPLDAAGRLVSGDPAAQTRQVLANLTAVLAGCGRAPADLARLTVWVASRDVLPAVEEVAGAFLRDAFPAGDGPATTVVVAPLVQPGALVQVEAVAATGPRRVVDTGTQRPGGLPQVGGVAVEISDEVDSFVRRFTWPEPLPGRPPDAPPSRRPLGEILFLSAQTGTGPDGALVDGGMGPQARRALENMRAVVEAAGGEFADIVQFDVFYADRSLYGAYNAERIAYLEQHNPESAWFAGSGPKALSPLPGALIEIESIAVLQGPPHRQEHT